MVDKLSPDRRSWNMGRVRSRNTKPEIAVRSVLHRMGFRFRINRRGLPGSPDIVLPKFQTVVFVHGCFWHRHQGCKRCSTPTTRREFWEQKFAENVQRDQRNQESLSAKGWQVVIVWECAVRKDPVEAALSIVKELPGVDAGEVYALPSGKEILQVAEKRMHYGLKKCD